MTENLEQVLEALRQIDKDVLEQAEASYRQESKRQAEDVAVLRLNLRALKEANQNTAKSVANLKENASTQQKSHARGKGRPRGKPALQTVTEEGEEEGEPLEQAAATEEAELLATESAAEPAAEGPGSCGSQATESPKADKGRGKRKGATAKAAAQAAAPAEAPARATRSRRAAMQEEMAGFVFPSPPKARVPRKKRAAAPPVAAANEEGSKSSEPSSKAKAAAEGQADAIAVDNTPEKTASEPVIEAGGDIPAKGANKEGEDTAAESGLPAATSQLSLAASGSTQAIGQQLDTAGTRVSDDGRASLQPRAVSRLASTTRSAALQQSAASYMSAEQSLASPAPATVPGILDARLDDLAATASTTAAAASMAIPATGRQAPEAAPTARPASTSPPPGLDSGGTAHASTRLSTAADRRPPPSAPEPALSTATDRGPPPSAPESAQSTAADREPPPRASELARSPQTTVLPHPSGAAAAVGEMPAIPNAPATAEPPPPSPPPATAVVPSAAAGSAATAGKELAERPAQEAPRTAPEGDITPAIAPTASTEQQADDTSRTHGGGGNKSRAQEASRSAVETGGKLPSAEQQELERTTPPERGSTAQESFGLTAIESRSLGTQAQPQQKHADEPPSESTTSAVAAETAPTPTAQDAAASDEPAKQHLPENKNSVEQACEAAQATGERPGTSQGAARGILGDSATAAPPRQETAEAGQQPAGLIMQASSNLLHGFRSLIPVKTAAAPLLGGPKKAPEVDALKAAEALRRREAGKEAERQEQKRKLKADRARHAQQVKAKQEEARRREAEEAKQRGDAMKKKEEEAASRRHAKEEADRKEREDKQRRLEDARSKKRQEEASRQDAEAKRQKLPQAAARADAGLQAPLKPSAHAVQHAAAAPKPPRRDEAAGESGAARALQQARQHVRPPPSPPAAAQSIEIAPYRGSDEESEDGDDTQLRPQWAVEPYLSQQLLAQRALDPDEIFQQHANTCSLDEVFSNLGTASDPKRDLNRRTSSGNWLKDRVTWREEINYKRAMGYLPQAGHDGDE